MQPRRSSLRTPDTVDSDEHHVRIAEWDERCQYTQPAGHTASVQGKGRDSTKDWVRDQVPSRAPSVKSPSSNKPSRPAPAPTKVHEPSPNHQMPVPAAAAVHSRAQPSSRAKPRMEAIPEYAPHHPTARPRHPAECDRPLPPTPAVPEGAPGSVDASHARATRGERSRQASSGEAERNTGRPAPKPAPPIATTNPRANTTRETAVYDRPAVDVAASLSGPPASTQGLPPVFARQTVVTRTRVFSPQATSIGHYKPYRPSMPFDTATFDEIRRHLAGHRSELVKVASYWYQICPGTYIGCMNCPQYRGIYSAMMSECSRRDCGFYGPFISRWTSNDERCNDEEANKSAKYECVRCEYGRAFLGGEKHDSYLGYCFNCRCVTELGIRLPGELRFCCGNTRCRKDAGPEFNYFYYCSSCRKTGRTAQVTTVSRAQEPLV